MHPVIFQIGDISLYTYGMFVAIGFLAAVLYSKKNALPYGYSPETITDLFFIILVSAIVGARLLYVIVNIKTFSTDFLGIFKIWNGGLVFFGGFICSVVSAIVYLKIKKLDIWLTADLLSPGVALGHAFGRVGCLFAGCCYGKECDLPVAITFTHPQTLAPLNIPLHPTQIYMVLSNLCLFFILLWVGKNKKFKGMVFLTYVMLYSFLRFIIEFFRGDFRGDFFFKFISLSQGIGLSVSLIALIFIIKLSRTSNE